MLKENDTCCLFEFDDEKNSTRMPEKKDINLPKVAVMCFFEEVIDKYSKLENVDIIMESYHDILAWKFYHIIYNNKEIVFCQAPM